MDLPAATDLGEAMLCDPQAHCWEVKDLPARPPGADVLARELMLANPALLRQLLDDLVDRQAALERLARVPRLFAARFALGLRQRRTRSLLAIAITARRTVRVPAGLPQARAKLDVLTPQQFQAPRSS